MEQAPGGHGANSRRLKRRTKEEEWRRSTYTTPMRYHRGMAGQCLRGHDGIKPGQVADDTSVNHLTLQAPDLTEDRAKKLEIKLEVAMAKIQSFGGEGDASVW
jgi:hypothetical protein